MEDAKITNDQSHDQMYQQGQYPSIVDTDDLVFELGKQVVNSINNEKIIKQLIEKAKQVETDKASEHEQKIFNENKLESLLESNKLYGKNNKDLSDEIVKLRNEIGNLKCDFDEKEKAFSDEKAGLEQTIKSLKTPVKTTKKASRSTKIKVK